MRFGYFAPFVRPDAEKPLRQVYRDTLEQIECADAVGFDVVWIPEHHFTHQYCSPDPLTSIVDLAHRTRRVKLGTSVIVAPLHHPLMVAEQIGLADQLTEGRLEIGFARGASTYEYDRLGLTDAQAAERLRECLDILVAVWERDEEVAYQGAHFSFPPTYVVPRPLQQPHPPIWVAARTPETLKFCIERGFGLHTTPLRQPASAVRATMNIIDSLVAEQEIVPRPTVAMQTEAFVSDGWGTVMAAMDALERSHIRAQNTGRVGRPTERGFGSLDPLPEGMRITAQQLAERSVVGDADACVGKLGAYQALGMNEFIASMDFGQSQRDILRSIELFGTQVIPRCRNTASVSPRQPGLVRAGAAERRAALAQASERRFGPAWQHWQATDWLGHFATQPDAAMPRCELFDFSLAPRNTRADASGVVEAAESLFLIRDEECPECGRPTIVLCYRPNGETPQQLCALLHRQARWSDWHALHP